MRYDNYFNIVALSTAVFWEALSKSNEEFNFFYILLSLADIGNRDRYNSDNLAK